MVEGKYPWGKLSWLYGAVLPGMFLVAAGCMAVPQTPPAPSAPSSSAPAVRPVAAVAAPQDPAAAPAPAAPQAVTAAPALAGPAAGDPAQGREQALLAPAVPPSSAPAVRPVAAVTAPQAVTAAPALAGPAAGDPAQGQQLFASRCNTCHPGGQQGVGPALAGATARLAEAEIVRRVRQGQEEMPPAGADFAEQQMADLLAYLRSLR